MMKLKPIVFYFCLLVSVFVTNAEDGHCSAKPNELSRFQLQALTSKIEEYEAKLKKYEQLLTNSSCSICNVNGINPCQNGGTCIVNDIYNYTCICPYNYDGPTCGTLIECKNNTCGVNANCTVFNHHTVCSCPFGFTGDPAVSCTLQSTTVCPSGDPHLQTFDHVYYDYQGTCPYVMTKTCDSNNFSVIATNKFANPPINSVSVIINTLIIIRGTEFNIDVDSNLMVNGIRANFPYYYPSATNAEVVATRSDNRVVTLKDLISLVTVTYSSYQLCVTIPHTEEFYGQYKLCGALGNIDGVCSNDFRTANNETVAIPCGSANEGAAAAVVDTWVTNSSVPGCVLGQVIYNNTRIHNCSTPEAMTKCSLIQDAHNGQGPFAACLALGGNDLQNYVNDCVFDVCQGLSVCDALKSFVDICQSLLPFANIANWRNQTGCPYSCPASSTYSLQTPNCQSTCSDIFLGNSTYCQDGYREGCICNPGYYVDTNVPDTSPGFVCRLLEDCGCTDDDGNYYPPKSSWLNPNCTTNFECANGQITFEPVECAEEAQCTNLAGSPTCVCDPGYSGDGYNCSDINECHLDSTLCGANVGHGKCVNDPGSYHCDCLLPYEGGNCENYLPSRHCADLYVFHKENVSDVYTIQAGAKYGDEQDPGNATQVYCDMDTDGGGWTLMSGGNRTSMKTFQQYVQGFGDPEALQVWLGLENLYTMTNDTETALRIVIDRCGRGSRPAVVTFCTYPRFVVSSADEQYAIFIPKDCQGGNETGYYDGWVDWNPSQLGPKFKAFDNDDTTSNCSANYDYTGWWYSSPLCGDANLNGIRIPCGVFENDYKTLTWSGQSVADVWLYLRPTAYPSYDDAAPVSS